MRLKRKSWKIWVEIVKSDVSECFKRGELGQKMSLILE